MEFEERSKNYSVASPHGDQTAKFHRSLKNLSGDIVLTASVRNRNKNKTNKQNKTKQTKKKTTVALHLHADLSAFSFAAWTSYSGGYICTTVRGANRSLHSLLPLQLLYDL